MRLDDEEIACAEDCAVRERHAELDTLVRLPPPARFHAIFPAERDRVARVACRRRREVRVVMDPVDGGQCPKHGNDHAGIAALKKRKYRSTSTRRTSSARRAAAASGSTRPVSHHRACDEPAFDHHLRLHAEEHGLPQDQIGHLADLGGADLVSNAVSDRRTDRVFGDITRRLSASGGSPGSAPR
jgi:hypothetical protein